MTFLQTYLRPLAVAAAFALFSLPSAGQTEAEKLMAAFSAAARFDYNFPRERVYVHLDNNAYLEGETIWMKVYVVRASSLMPAKDMSRVVYAELLDEAGRIVDRKLLRTDSLGQAEGDFKLELPVRAGYYEVRAYTREMTNWGEEACYSRVVPVFALRGENLDVPRVEMPKKTSTTFPRPAWKGNESDVRLEMYPEGGARVAGVASNIAFRLTDGRGNSIENERLSVVDENGNEITTALSGHEGLGRFPLANGVHGGAVVIRGKRFDLPEETEAEFALTAVPNQTDGGYDLYIYGGNNAPAQPLLLGVASFSRSRATFFDTLSLARGEAVEMQLPAEALRAGVNRIELFTPDGRSVAQRLVWSEEGLEKNVVTVDVRQNAHTWDAFSPVALELKLKGADGQAVSTPFSISVCDAGSDLVAAADDAQADMLADLLLCSEVRGYVHRPQWYFTPSTPDSLRRLALDNLLLVQGWCSDSFDRMSGAEAFTPSQPIEEKLTLNGRVIRDNNRGVPMAGQRLRINMYSKEGASLSGEAVTDADGRWAFASSADFTGEWIAQFSVRDTTDRLRWSRICIDRWFMPEPRALSDAELTLEKPQPFAAATEEEAADTFEWEDTIPRILMSSTLGTAVVSHKSLYHGLRGGRYTYNGGEKFGQRHAVVFYNIALETERRKDEGGETGDIYHFLESIDSKVSVQPGDDITSDEESYLIRYRNSSPAIYVNNDKDYKLNLSTMPADDFKSVAIVKAGSNGTSLDPVALDSATWGMFFYERQDSYRFQEKKGITKRRVEGYSRPRAFYSPSYRGLDLPSDDDQRRTLYWNPTVHSDKDGKASVVFFTGAKSVDHLRVVVRAITADGRVVVH